MSYRVRSRCESRKLRACCWLKRRPAYIVCRIWVCAGPPRMIQSAVLLECFKGPAVGGIVVDVATGAGGIEDVAEASWFAAKMMSTIDN